MHELPKDLSNSLRSWRGSIYGSVRKSPSDLEKGAGDIDDKAFDQALGATQSSLVLHPTASSQGLNRISQHHAQQWNEPPSQQQQQQEQQQSSQRRQPYDQLDQIQTVVPHRQATFPPQTPASAKKSILTAPKVDDPDPAADRLDDDPNPLTTDEFYELIGMRRPDVPNQNPKDLATRNGLYGKIQAQLHYIQLQYRIYDILVYVLLILQLFLSAMFIILGSLQKVDTHLTIAILGAVSTVIAGALALMKGNGLPNRLRQYRDALRTVTFEAEELYWDVGADKSVYYKDIKKIREDYLRVLEMVRKNHPDTWNQTSDTMMKAVGAPARTKGTKPG